MDLATLVVAAIIIVLQVITLGVVLSDRKKRAAVEPPQAAREEDRTRDRRDFNRDKFRRPNQQQPGPQFQQNQRRPPEPPAPAPVTTPVDKSLRDINLRLKSAERDQERARKEVRSGGLAGEGPQMRSRDRQERGDRFDRGDRGDRGRRPDRRGDRRDRDNRPRTQYQRELGAPQGAPAAPQAELEPKEIREATPVTVAPPEQTFEAPREIAVQEPETAAPTAADAESIEHGRKFVVKRRELRGGEEGAEAGAAEEPASSEQPRPSEQEPAASAPSAEDGSEQKSEPVYGRR